MGIQELLNKVKDCLIEDEGYERKPYVDTVGKITIGVGWNLSDNGLPDDIIHELLDRAVNDTYTELVARVPFFPSLPEKAKIVLLNMAFNMGVPRLLKFKRMLSNMKAWDWNLAAYEMLDSKWARQVPKRAQRLAKLIRSIV